MAIHSILLAWRIATDRGAWWATVHGAAESDTPEQLSTEQHDNLEVHPYCCKWRYFILCMVE